MARHGSTYNKLIGSREWRAFRLMILREEPLCRWCLQKGMVRVARCVHHQIECETAKTEQAMRDLMFSKSNCVPLCLKCHSDYHNQQGYHKPDKVEERQEDRMEQWKDALEKQFD